MLDDVSAMLNETSGGSRETRRERGGGETHRAGTRIEGHDGDTGGVAAKRCTVVTGADAGGQLGRRCYFGDVGGGVAGNGIRLVRQRELSGWNSRCAVWSR